jgi:hypothetical protein
LSREEESQMMKKLSVGLVATALVLSGAMVGVSYGGPSGITEPEVIELRFDPCSTRCRYFLMDELNGPSTGQVTLTKNPLFDADGNKAGNVNVSCTVSDGPGGGTDWVCIYIHTLKAGPYTEQGTVTTTGIYTGEDVDVFAVTGGTGAYVNVRGYAALEYGPGELNYTLNLIP